MFQTQSSSSTLGVIDAYTQILNVDIASQLKTVPFHCNEYV
jgi:hypothetical protein